MIWMTRTQFHLRRLNSRLLSAILAAGCSLLLCSCASQKPSSMELPKPVSITDVSEGKKPIIVMVSVLGDELVPFMVDSGTPETTIDISLESKLGKRLGKTRSNWAFYTNATVGVYAAPKLKLGSAILATGSRVKCDDLGKVFQMRFPIKGVLGLDCLEHYCVQLDFLKRQMRFFDPELLATNELGEAYPLSIGWGGGAYMQSSLFCPGHLEFRVDTGLAGADFMLKPKVFERELGSQKPISSGAQSRKDFLAKFSFGGEVFTNEVHLRNAAMSNHVNREAALFAKMIVGGERYSKVAVVNGTQQKWPTCNWMGLTFLTRHLVTLNFPKGVMYLKQLPDTPTKISSENTHDSNPSSLSDHKLE